MALRFHFLATYSGLPLHVETRLPAVVPVVETPLVGGLILQFGLVAGHGQFFVDHRQPMGGLG
jgi:hypothetical protein